MPFPGSSVHLNPFTQNRTGAEFSRNSLSGAQTFQNQKFQTHQIMRNRSLSTRLLHIAKQFSLYWLIASATCLIAVGPEILASPAMKITTGIALALLSMDQFASLFSKIVLPPDWLTVYPELQDSCYSKGNSRERNARIFGNLSITIGIIAAYFFLLGNSYIALTLVFFACILHVIFAVFNGLTFPAFRTDWSVVYPELTETAEQNQ